jgi:endonuclease G
MSPQDDLLRAAVSRMEASDGSLAEELRAVRERGLATAAAGGGAVLESTLSGTVLPPSQASLETIVLRVGRPVLAIVEGRPRFETPDTESEVWRSRLAAAAEPLRRAARAVGRIEVQRHPQLQWVGTGWLVADDTIVTNRHVAVEFGARGSDRFTFRQGLGGGRIGSAIDFLREVDQPARLQSRVVEILYIADDDGPDVAMLRIEPVSTGDRPQPIPLAGRTAVAGQQIAVVGYPARDSRIPDQRLMQSIFGDVYDRKRLAPGQVTDVQADVLLHDCSTLGGNSGSVLLDLASGRAVGLHFAGRFLEANYAVPAAIVAERFELARRRGKPITRSGRQGAVPPRATVGAATPIVGTVSRVRRPAAPTSDDEPFVEARVEDYVDRGGYDPAFLGSEVSFPRVSDRRDVLTFAWNGTDEHELKYEHFSVVMSRSRRLCYFSAVNIDGRQPHRMKRPGWRLDPRIPAAQQIRDECYGSAPRFSRGHMTRREDPIWGPPAAAALGNEDSMHVTNTVPQMQPFNAGIWLGLENYALEHAREDDMRISVFTGPFLAPDDPERFGVRVPREFWKVIAFVHDGTRELCATGYTMSQEEFLREDEFVFGRHQTWQTPIRQIEERAGIRFADLASVDPLGSVDEAFAAPLSDFAQIVFTA